MTIRPALASDHAAVMRLGVRFAAEYGGVPTPALIRVVADAVLGLNPELTGRAVVAEAADGHLCGLLGLVVALHEKTGIVTAMEQAWYLEPDARGGTAGVRLVREAEALARDAGVPRMQIGAPNATVQRLLTRLGYRAVETVMVKELA